MLGRLEHGRVTLEPIARFANTPLHLDGSVRWDVGRLQQHLVRALAAVADARPSSIGVDAWGCDFALLDPEGDLLDPPYHYRDSRTDGVMAAVFERLPRERIYAETGVQFLPFNTLYQLYAACRARADLVARAASLVTIPDLVNHWLTGRIACEFTNATTTQMVHAGTRTWATDLLTALDLPAHLPGPLVEPGTTLGPLRAEMNASLAGVPVIAPACHDTGSAVAAVAASGRTAFLSSGTWSLLGTEVPAPVITARGRDLNFTNEGGVAGTTRLLKNIMGLWLLQACRRDWTTASAAPDYDDLLAAARTAPPFRALIDPDDPAFLHPARMTAAIAAACRDTGQPPPSTTAEFTRTVLESLAFKYRLVLESLEEVTGTAFDTIRVVGGGALNRLLNQFTADATGRAVVAGPVEATTLGNAALQWVASGAVASLADARDSHRPVLPGRAVRAAAGRDLEPTLRPFSDLCGECPCLRLRHLR